MKPRKIIEEIRSIEDYEFEIFKIENELRRVRASYKSGPAPLKDPMNWERITIENRDGTQEDARYCAPKNKVAPPNSNLHLLEYEEELEEKLLYNQLALKQARQFRDRLLASTEGEFMKAYLDGESLTKLTNRFHYANPHTHAVRVVARCFK